MAIAPSKKTQSHGGTRHNATTMKCARKMTSTNRPRHNSRHSASMSLSTLPDTIQQLESFWPSVFTFDQFKFHDKILGEGRTGKVVLADYLGVPVACKMRRPNQPRSEFVKRLQRELRFAAELAVCRSVNPYLGVVAFKRSEFFQTRTGRDPNDVEYFGVQRYYEQGDLLAYTNNRGIGKARWNEKGRAEKVND
ncbi:hypothetical protein BX666DRAFT_1362458 [Dichotomocladium elegans]|nr:hypothetical protein BX666DRAFT_1362458 [Dichotomocladium elegans]